MVVRRSGTTAAVARRLALPGGYPCGLTWDGVQLWHSDQGAERIYALSAETGEVLRILVCAQVRADLTYHDGCLYQVGGRPKRLVLVDPQTGAVREERAVPPASGRLCGVEAVGSDVWMCLRSPAVLQLRDLDTMRVRREIPVPGNPSGLTRWGDVLLYSDFEDALVRAVDGTSGELLAEVPVEGRPVGMTVAAGYVWYCDFAARQVKAIEPVELLGTG